MAIGGQFRELGEFLDRCEQGERSVRDVRVTQGADGLVADVDVAVPLEDPPAVCSPRLDGDGTLRVGLEATRSFPRATETGLTVEPTDVTGSDGDIVVTLRATSPDAGTAERATDGDGEAEADTGERRDTDLPPFKDPDHLADIFAAHDTFGEMAEAIDMDVTAETVRRYMIDYGIHEPSSYTTQQVSPAGDDGEAEDAPEGDATSTVEPQPEEPVVLSDGIGLPEDVTVDTLIETVKRADTIHEVTREVAVEREDALEMLERLNLLDLVVGRLATEGERDISRAEILDRLRDAPQA